MKYLVVGLGNVGEEYAGTRHNCGFMVVDRWAAKAEARFALERHAFRTELSERGRKVILLKPTTYMNLSGKAVRYWMAAEKVELEHVLIVVDDIALPVGTLRMKKGGSGGGHNGLADVEAALGTSQYCRLRIGIGNNFSRGRQIDYVLGHFEPDELSILDSKLDTAVDMAKCFVTQGADRAMNLYNGK
ncbi:MAG: aminoacyl-tRNA hydrolase [Bacteroidales bacterium]|nr:aminoacyl-tRNA hydrolase [Bacteroidales bacterium]